jgi:hypothetical protein
MALLTLEKGSSIRFIKLDGWHGLAIFSPIKVGKWNIGLKGSCRQMLIRYLKIDLEVSIL